MVVWSTIAPLFDLDALDARDHVLHNSSIAGQVCVNRPTTREKHIVTTGLVKLSGSGTTPAANFGNGAHLTVAPRFI
jgi:hypothetical protein